MPDLHHRSAVQVHSAARMRSHQWLWLVATMLLANPLLSNACSSRENGPLAVSLAQLAADEGAYDRHEVITQGIVRQFEDTDGTVYDIIEDGRSNRVELEPTSAAGAYVGQQVSVIGTFHFDDQQGRSIRVERVSAVGA